MFKPLVSIIIPVYNGSNYMREAIDSALNQTYKNIEVLVVNDGSRDDGATDKIASSYGDRIRYFRKENGGVSSALNLGIKKMRGEYFSWLSHDDKYELNKIQTQVETLEKSDGEVLERLIVLCESDQINKKSKKIMDTPKRFPKNGVYSGNVVLKNLLTKGSFNGCALLIPKQAFEKCGEFDENLRYSQDALMWYKFFLNGFKLQYVSDICVSNRIHDKQVTQTGRSLLFHDSLEVSKQVVPELVKNEEKKELLYLFTKREALWNCRDAVNFCLSADDEYGILSFLQREKIEMTFIYGKIRPFIRRLYYRFVKKIVTQ